MGSICDVAEEVIDYLTAAGEKVGLIKVRLYRPWVSASLLKVLPKTAKKVAVLDRTKEPGALGDPLYLDVATTLREAGLNDVVLCGGRYGLGSKDTPPSSVFAIYKELEKEDFVKVLTRTLLRLSVTTQINTSRHTSSMTLRRPVV